MADHTFATGALTSNVAGIVTSVDFLTDNSASALGADEKIVNDKNAAAARDATRPRFEEVMDLSPA